MGVPLGASWWLLYSLPCNECAIFGLQHYDILLVTSVCKKITVKLCDNHDKLFLWQHTPGGLGGHRLIAFSKYFTPAPTTSLQRWCSCTFIFFIISHHPQVDCISHFSARQQLQHHPTELLDAQPDHISKRWQWEVALPPCVDCFLFFCHRLIVFSISKQQANIFVLQKSHHLRKCTTLIWVSKGLEHFFLDSYKSNDVVS